MDHRLLQSSVRSVADLMRLFARNSIEVGKVDQYVLHPVIPERANSGSETRFSAENQPEKRGRPRGSRNKMSPALKKMIVEVAEEVGRVPYEDWDKIPCADGVKGYLRSMAIRDMKVFAMLMYRVLPPPPKPRRASRACRPWTGE
jgi:hypothetical protein